jgi:hypothetical protein
LELTSSSLQRVQTQEPDTAPTGVRWRIVALLAFLAGLTYLDRLNLGIVDSNIQEEFKFSTQNDGLDFWCL